MSGAPLRCAGLPITLGGQAYTLPPLSAAVSKRYWSRIQAMQRGEEPDPLGLVADLVHACLLRNYPDMDAGVVADAVDVDNVEELSAKCMGAGSFRRWVALQAERLAEEAAEGNALAPQMPTAGTGAPSMPPSPPAPAGDSATSTS